MGPGRGENPYGGQSQLQTILPILYCIQVVPAFSQLPVGPVHIRI